MIRASGILRVITTVVICYVFSVYNLVNPGSEEENHRVFTLFF